MAKNTFTSWQHLPPMGQQTGGPPGTASNTFPINNAPEPWYRDRLDALRAGRVPEAEYPDGYLGATRTRREDRTVAHGGNNTGGTSKSYARGIHVGSRVQPDAYFWTKDVSMQVGLELQAQGQKFAPRGEIDMLLTNDGKPGPVRGSASLRMANRAPQARSA